MTGDMVIDAVAALTNRAGTNDPGELCSFLGIQTFYEQLGKHDGSSKGFAISKDGCTVITVNSDLPFYLQTVIHAHELGHVILHLNGCDGSFQELSLFDDTDLKERDANLFAAELLLSDSEVMDALNEDTTFFQAAAQLCVPYQILDYKFRLMKKKGYRMKEPPAWSDARFLRHLEWGKDANYYSE